MIDQTDSYRSCAVNNRKPHPHAAIIKAWADGAQIQWRFIDPKNRRYIWEVDKDGWKDDNNPWWHCKEHEFRVKPVPHKWQKEMDAYEAGKTVQVRLNAMYSWSEGVTKDSGGPPAWITSGDWEYRIKPEPVVKFVKAKLDVQSGALSLVYAGEGNLRMTFLDGKLIKAEVIE